jgi:hypothetical protein
MSNRLTIDEFLNAIDICEDGVSVMEELGTYGLSVDEAIVALRNAGHTEFAAWLKLKKDTEAYVRFNGDNINMGAYQVFSPLTGTHTRYETETEAKAALVEIAKEILNQHCPTVVQELSNENGDTTWIPTNLHETLEIQ